MSWPLLKKEFKELYRTYRIWVVPAVFLFIGLSSPAAAKFLPDIFKGQLEAQRIAIKFPKPTVVDAYMQYFKNLTQLGVLAVILLSMGLVSEDKVRGVLAQIITKPVSRAQVVLTKFVVHGLFLAGSFAVGGAGAYLYTLALFGRGRLTAFIQANAVFLVYLLVIFTVTLLFSTLCRNQTLAGGLALLAFLALSLAPMVSRVLDKHSPAGLTGLVNKLAAGTGSLAASISPTLTSLTAIIILLALAVLAFSRQEV